MTANTGAPRAPAPPLTQNPALVPQSPVPAAPPATPALDAPSLPPTPAQAAREQQAELERVEAQAREEERRRAALRAYLNPFGPSGLRAKPLVGRPRLLGD